MQRIHLLVPAGHIPSLDKAARTIDEAIEWNWLAYTDLADHSGRTVTIDEVVSFLGQRSCDFVMLPQLSETGPAEYAAMSFYAVLFPQWIPENDQYKEEILRILLEYVYAIWQSELAADRHERQVRLMKQHLQEYDTYCQVLSDLISIKSERILKQILPRLLNDFFQPGEYYFWSPDKLPHLHSSNDPDPVSFAAGKDICKLITSDQASRPDGFMIKVENPDGLLGIISLQKLAFPENLDRYIKYAANIARAVAMVITNARSYRAIINSERKLKYSSTHDSLTELYNRPAFNEKITALAESVDSWPVAVFACDINGLKSINDLYGHTEGDRLILRAAEVLRRSFRENDFIARVGGDEFSILLPSCSKTTAEQIRSRLKAEIAANNLNHLYPLSLAVGFVLWRGPEISYDHALMLADIAMYDDKQNNRLQPAAQIYQPESAKDAPGDLINRWEQTATPAMALPLTNDKTDDHPLISALQYRQIFDNMFTGYALHEMIFDKNGRACDYRFVDMNPAFENMTGFDRHHCLGRTILACSPKTDALWIRRYADVVQTGRHAHFEQYAAAINKYFEIYAFRTELNRFATLVLDISQRKKMELELAASEARYRSVIANISDVISIIDSDDKIRYISPNIRRWFGWDAEQLIGRSALEMIDPAGVQRITDQQDQLLSSELAVISERVKIRCRDGQMKDIELTAVNLQENQHIKGILVNFRDISEQIKSEHELQHLSTHDALTGLYNREFFDKAIQKIIRAEDLPFCLVLGDVNGLRLINNSFGIESGNRTLTAIADVLLSIVPEKAVTARVGGDEFAILLPQTVLEDAQQLCQKIKQACIENHSQMEAKNQSIFASMTLGYACQETPGKTIGQLFQQAENLLYRRKLLERKSLYSTLLTSIKATMFAKSFETESHAARMVELSEELGREASLDADQLNDLSLFATLHDLGKIGIENQILDKPGRLTGAEWLEIKRHPEIGHQIAISTPDLTPIAHLILTHHEHWDGSGYPQGLQGKAIPLLSRLLAIVDAYDAMTQDRPYRRAMPVNRALQVIEANAGTQFDPELAGYFIQLIKKKNT